MGPAWLAGLEEPANVRAGLLQSHNRCVRRVRKGDAVGSRELYNVQTVVRTHDVITCADKLHDQRRMVQLREGVDPLQPKVNDERCSPISSADQTTNVIGARARVAEREPN